MKIKDVQLKNGKIASIHFQALPVGIVYFAANSKHRTVAKCWFDIISTYILQNPKTTLVTSSASTAAILPSNQEIEIAMSDLISKNIQIETQSTILKDGKIYVLKDSYCKLELIEINDPKFYKVGLGTTLLKEMENFANQHNCTSLRAWVKPFGAFAKGTLAFYERNGFTLTKNGMKSLYATKQLNTKQPQNLNDLSKQK